jgi:hypothetical protein
MPFRPRSWLVFTRACFSGEASELKEVADSVMLKSVRELSLGR